eukprot:PhM_4_TR17422/c4_g1_i4/m.78018
MMRARSFSWLRCRRVFYSQKAVLHHMMSPPAININAGQVCVRLSSRGLFTPTSPLLYAAAVAAGADATPPLNKKEYIPADKAFEALSHFMQKHVTPSDHGMTQQTQGALLWELRQSLAVLQWEGLTESMKMYQVLRCLQCAAPLPFYRAISDVAQLVASGKTDVDALRPALDAIVKTLPNTVPSRNETFISDVVEALRTSDKGDVHDVLVGLFCRHFSMPPPKDWCVHGWGMEGDELVEAVATAHLS